MTEQEVITLVVVVEEEEFDWIFIPTGPGNIRVPCYTIGVPASDSFAQAGVFERPQWEKANWRELFAGQEGQVLIDCCDIDWD